jgi:molecular chaperone DnaK
MVHATDKSLKDAGDKVSEADKGEAEGALAAARSALEGDDVEAIKTASERLSAASMKLGEAIYKAQAAAEEAAKAGATPPPPGANPNEKVVDAEFEDLDPKKKK